MIKPSVRISLLLISLLPFGAEGLCEPDPLFKDPKTEEQIRQIESDLSREREKFEVFDSQEKELLQELSYLEKEVGEKKQALEELEGKMRIEREEAETLQEKQRKLQQSLKVLETRLEKRLVVLYKYTRRGSMKVLASAKDLNQFGRRIKYLGTVLAEDQRILAELQNQRVKHKKEIHWLEEKLKQIEAESIKGKEQLVSLRQELEKKVIRLMKVHQEKEFHETGMRELQKAAEELKRTLIRLDSAESVGTSFQTGFKEEKGHLPLPLPGRVLSGNPSPSEKSQLQKGIFIECESEEEVRAVFPGRVDFSGWLKGYGEVIIMNHGSRYFTISAQLSRRSKKKGDLIDKGEVIGKVSGDGSRRPVLYFEIRRGGENLDPLAWLQVR